MHLGYLCAPPLPQIIEKRFSTMSWFSLLVCRYDTLYMLWRTSHNCNRQLIAIFQPFRQGGIFEHPKDLIVDNQSSAFNRNSLCPDFSDRECLILAELLRAVPLKQLNNWSMFSQKSAVCCASLGRPPRLHMVVMPAATEWLRTSVANFTLSGANGSKSTCLDVSFGAIRIGRLESAW